MKTIDATQKEALLAFTKSHYVKYLDLQAEVVALLTDDIEARWAQNPTISFDAALDTAFKKWGVFGFSTFVSEKSAALNKRYYSITWQQLFSHFKGKRLLYSLLVYAVFTLFMHWISIDYDWCMGSIFACFIIGLFWSFYLSYISQKKDRTIQNRSLYHDVVKQHTMSFPYLITMLACQLCLHFNLPHNYWTQPWFVPVVSGFILLISVIQYDCGVIIPQLALAEFEKK